MGDYPKDWQDELAAAHAEATGAKVVDVTLACAYHYRPLEKTDAPEPELDRPHPDGRFFRCPEPNCPVITLVMVGAPEESK